MTILIKIPQFHSIAEFHSLHKRIDIRNVLLSSFYGRRRRLQFSILDNWKGKNNSSKIEVLFPKKAATKKREKYDWNFQCRILWKCNLASESTMESSSYSTECSFFIGIESWAKRRRKKKRGESEVAFVEMSHSELQRVLLWRMITIHFGMLSKNILKTSFLRKEFARCQCVRRNGNFNDIQTFGIH